MLLFIASLSVWYLQQQQQQRERDTEAITRQFRNS